ncbi:sigma-70 family RNA polymerase sigma factor [Rhodococcus sp. F64268]|uniref:sigma-70 family RNA polymerase sigma factor n=1 Tax=Rhodococcus sp. F64268 TaxID=2926402 RepID=UPI001FF57076|nr:sigma-70 family RNA polymerase sigma factor [Rhodococcus sp. F64268]MCK0093378.1 sigma-70 family RNA polymerase sigma factor [Rhodococcus sp. F64268]
MISVADFEAARPPLTRVAFRLLGSIHDAEDAVQTTWIRASTADSGDIRNPTAWLTTILTRVCLDQLRTRRRHREEPLLTDAIPAEELAADEQYIQREQVSRALMVLLGCLTPAQRVAYVLHDLFGVPFAEVAHTLNTGTVNAKKHASRARRCIEEAQSPPAAADDSVVDAFLTAAAGGDIDRMLSLMTDDCERIVDPTLAPPGTASVVTGARAVAEETTLFVDRIRALTRMTVGGRHAHVVAPGGRVLALLDIETRSGLVGRIRITRVDHAEFASRFR